MGHAAYMRGSRAISRQFCEEVGCGGCSLCRPKHKPTPRPEGWGDKAKARAADHAQRIIAGRAKYGMPPPSVEVLSGAVQDRARVSESTATQAAKDALKE